MNGKAKWIWIHKDFCDEPEYVLFRKTVWLETVPEKAELCITADSRYILSINGQVISRGPARSTAYVRYCDTVDAAPYLRQGSNVLAVDAIHYAGDEHKINEFAAGPISIPTSSRGGLLIEGDCRFCTDHTYRCKNLDAYRFRRAEIAAYLGYFEQVDGRCYPFGWREPAFDDSTWSQAVERVENVPYSLGGLANVWQTEPRPIPLPYETEKPFAGVSRTNSEEGEEVLRAGMTVAPDETVYVDLDAGVYRTGFAELEIENGWGAEIRLIYAESYMRDMDGAVCVKGKRDDSSGDSFLCGDSDIYIAGKGRQTYTTFHYRAFRFIRLAVKTAHEPVTVRVRGFRETGYPLAVTTVFRCRDETWARMWDISLRTLRCCMYETYMDCPYYEQMQYLMDTLLEGQYTYAVSTDSRLMEKAIRDFYEYQLPNGLIPCNAPSRFVQIIPGFTLCWIFILYNHYWRFKNEAFLEQYFPGIEKIIGYFKRHLTADFLLRNTGFWQFVDWAETWKNGVPLQSEQETNLIYCMMFVTALKQSAYLAQVLHRDSYAQELLRCADRIAAAIERQGYDRERGLYRDVPGRAAYSQHGQVWAVLSGVADRQRGRDILTKSLLDKSVTPCSLCMHYFLFRALETVQLYRLSEPMWDTWKHIMDMNVTTWPEDGINWRSDCHAWSAAPLYEFVSCGLGIRPEAPGFTTVHIEPQMLWLSRCEGSLETGAGPIGVKWWVDREAFRMEVSTRGPTAVTAVLPDGTVHRQTVTGLASYSCLLESAPVHRADPENSDSDIPAALCLPLS